MKVIKANDPYVIFQGAISRLQGQFPTALSNAPDFTLLDSNLQNKQLADYARQTLVLITSPSIDTPIAANILRLLEQRTAPWQKTKVISVSEDLPFALSRFAKWEGLNRVSCLSSYRSQFGADYGLTIVEGLLSGLLAPSLLIIVDKQIVYAERMLNLTDEPNFEALDKICR